MARVMQLGLPTLNFGLRVKGLKVTNIAPDDFPGWKRSEAHLCMVLKNPIQSSLKQMFSAYDTCYEVWKQVKSLYTNDTQHLYGVYHDLFNVVSPRTQDLLINLLSPRDLIKTWFPH